MPGDDGVLSLKFPYHIMVRSLYFLSFIFFLSACKKSEPEIQEPVLVHEAPALKNKTTTHMSYKFINESGYVMASGADTLSRLSMAGNQIQIISTKLNITFKDMREGDTLNIPEDLNVHFTYKSSWGGGCYNRPPVFFKTSGSGGWGDLSAEFVTGRIIITKCVRPENNADNSKVELEFYLEGFFQKTIREDNGTFTDNIWLKFIFSSFEK
jgi:hypothetical protein